MKIHPVKIEPMVIIINKIVYCHWELNSDVKGVKVSDDFKGDES